MHYPLSPLEVHARQTQRHLLCRIGVELASACVAWAWSCCLLHLRWALMERLTPSTIPLLYVLWMVTNTVTRYAQDSMTVRTNPVALSWLHLVSPLVAWR